MASLTLPELHLIILNSSTCCCWEVTAHCLPLSLALWRSITHQHIYRNLVINRQKQLVVHKVLVIHTWTKPYCRLKGRGFLQDNLKGEAVGWPPTSSWLGVGGGGGFPNKTSSPKQMFLLFKSLQRYSFWHLKTKIKTTNFTQNLVCEKILDTEISY